MNIIAAITAVAEMPAALRDLTRELKELGNKLNKAQATERLASKRKRNAAAVRTVLNKRVSGAKAGHGGGDNKPPAV
tara:strand:- start:2926 stop:3156 length:231 start_codon:yes stop_codon:yes gene_type:complete